MPAPQLAYAAVALYLGFSIPASWAIARWHYERSRAVEDLVLGVAEARRDSRGRRLLTGVSTEAFTAGMVDIPFRVLEIPRGLPGTGCGAAASAPRRNWWRVRAAARLGPAGACGGESRGLRRLGSGLAKCHRALPGAGQATWKPETPRAVYPGDEMYASYLVGGWGKAEDGYRAMAGAAAKVRIGRPRNPAERLWLEFSRHERPICGYASGESTWLGKG